MGNKRHGILSGTTRCINLYIVASTEQSERNFKLMHVACLTSNDREFGPRIYKFIQHSIGEGMHELSTDHSERDFFQTFEN